VVEKKIGEKGTGFKENGKKRKLFRDFYVFFKEA